MCWGGVFLLTCCHELQPLPLAGCCGLLDNRHLSSRDGNDSGMLLDTSLRTPSGHSARWEINTLRQRVLIGNLGKEYCGCILIVWSCFFPLVPSKVPCVLWSERQGKWCGGQLVERVVFYCSQYGCDGDGGEEMSQWVIGECINTRWMWISSKNSSGWSLGQIC